MSGPSNTVRLRTSVPATCGPCRVPRGAVEAHPRAASDAATRPSVVLRESQARRFERNQVAEVRNREQKLQRFARKIALDRVLRPASFVHWPFDETAGDFAAVQVTGTSSADSNKPGTPVLPLPTRNERGENQGEGKVQETRPALPNPLLPFPGREGEARATSIGARTERAAPGGFRVRNWNRA